MPLADNFLAAKLESIFIIITITRRTTAVAYAWSMFSPYFERLYMRTESVLADENTLVGTFATVPAV